jgi:hypothetical protein
MLRSVGAYDEWRVPCLRGVDLEFGLNGADNPDIQNHLIEAPHTHIYTYINIHTNVHT